ncbi:MAG: class I SAM-dependent methyltransferase [Bacteroidales bacterium]|nr:class I SAM-dependent methyltransferase [Bacteroidales bacterium]
MRNSKSQIENQYYKADLFEDICKKLEQQGIDLNKVSRSDISRVDEFHVRGAEVSNELVQEIYLNDAKVLDVGCGLGGSSRMLADRFNCQVTGIDLCEEYVSTAQKLSELVGLTDQTEFIHGDALNLPFMESSFDIVWTQHVQMNIADKAKFYSEIKRVLNDEGALVYYDIFKKGKEDVNYPLPWANNASISFLESIQLVDALLNDLGFVKLQTSDQTNKAKHSLINTFEKVKMNGLPKLGLNVLMGTSTNKKLVNILKAIEENKIELQSGIYRKKSAFDNKDL